MIKHVKYEDIFSVGVELFKKNNDTFLRSKLSTTMNRIFKAANKGYVSSESEAYYMKSGELPDRVFYIYSDELTESLPSKGFDIVTFKDNYCIWFYTTNMINRIDKHPVQAISNMYEHILDIFEDRFTLTGFIRTELELVNTVMTIKLIGFLHETYGVLDMATCKSEIVTLHLSHYTKESAMKFIDDVLDNYYNKEYFNSRLYLDSYLLLEEK